MYIKAFNLAYFLILKFFVFWGVGFTKWNYFRVQISNKCLRLRFGLMKKVNTYFRLKICYPFEFVIHNGYFLVKKQIFKILDTKKYLYIRNLKYAHLTSVFRH